MVSYILYRGIWFKIGIFETTKNQKIIQRVTLYPWKFARWANYSQGCRRDLFKLNFPRNVQIQKSKQHPKKYKKSGEHFPQKHMLSNTKLSGRAGRYSNLTSIINNWTNFKIWIGTGIRNSIQRYF